MRGQLRWKIVLILCVLVLSATVGIYPMVASRYHLYSPSWLQSKQLKLGLDLQGGVHLVLRVETDFVLRDETVREMERIREALQRRGTSDIQLVPVDATQFRADGVTAILEPAFSQAVSESAGEFDRSSGVSGSYTFTMRANVAAQLRADAVVQARETIERRVNELGVAEPSIAQQGASGDRIVVQLPGVTNVARAKEIIQSTGRLEFKIVEQGPAPTRETLLGSRQVPAGMDIIVGSTDEPDDTNAEYYLVGTLAPVTGRDLRSARPTIDENGLPAVSFTLKTDGGRKFGQLTGDNIGRRLAIILDGEVKSAPYIEGRITTEGRIAGIRSQDEAQNLSLLLRTGALPAPMTYLEERTIGASLGADSIRSGITASIVGLLLIVVFLLAYYRLSGVNAVLALTFNLIMLLGLMAYVGAVMTLPGIAGFILTMGIGVDSNVLIFERIKEERGAQRSVRASINAGFSRVFLTLLDTHVAALISAAFLWMFGSGPIRGFAVTLSVGLVANLFTSTFVSKTLFEILLTQRRHGGSLSI